MEILIPIVIILLAVVFRPRRSSTGRQTQSVIDGFRNTGH
jgi:hypothetical protein